MSYLFVDGAYLSEVISRWSVEWFGEAATFDPVALSRGHQKTFFYDAMPVEKDGEDETTFNNRIATRREYFNKLRAVPGWHVVLGDSKRRHGKKGKPPRVEQKEVDVLIAVDMLTHTHRRNTDQITFIAGDLDFRPLLEAVVREGMYIELVYDHRSVAEELTYEADTRRPFEINEWFSILDSKFRIKHPFPIASNSNSTFQPQDGVLLEVARTPTGQEVARLYKTLNSPNTSGRLISSSLPDQRGQYPYYVAADGNVELLKKLHEHYHGSPAWFSI